MHIGVVCIPQMLPRVGEHMQPAQEKCFFTSAVQIDREAVTKPMMPITFPMPPRWSSVVEVSLSRIQLNSSITSNPQRMPPERVQVEVPEGVVLLIRGCSILQGVHESSRVETRVRNASSILSMASTWQHQLLLRPSQPLCLRHVFTTAEDRKTKA